MREKIAVDLDDVLSASAEGFVAFSNEQWGTTLTAEEYSEEWAVVWGCSLEEAQRRSDLFHQSGAVDGYKHFPHAIPVLRALAKRFDMSVVTSRQSLLQPKTDSWLDRHFTGIFQEIHYAGMWDTDDHVEHALKQTKADVCQRIGANYLIDDQLKHCIGVAECGVKAILFGDYRWNRAVELPPGVTRAATWDDVARYFDVES